MHATLMGSAAALKIVCSFNNSAWQVKLSVDQTAAGYQLARIKIMAHHRLHLKVKTHVSAYDIIWHAARA